MTLSVVIITYNEEANLPRTLASVAPLVHDLGGEIIVVDSHSTDRTREIAANFGAKVFEEDWKGFAAQKNSAIDKAQGDWVLLLDADEEVESALANEIAGVLRAECSGGLREDPISKHADSSIPDELKTVELVMGAEEGVAGLWLPRKNLFLNRWMKHGGFWPDPKLRLLRRGAGRVEDRAVHETIKVSGATATLGGALIHHAYPTLDIYLEHMRRYADLSATMIAHKPRLVLWLNRWLNPPLTFFYNYIVRLGFLDGREGFLLHRYHARYVGWKYDKALKLARERK